MAAIRENTFTELKIPDIPEEYARYPRQLEMLSRLAINPPQTLLLEGGTEKARLNFALYWAMAANCPVSLEQISRRNPGKPCLACPTCHQILAAENQDILVFDGRIANRQDEEAPGSTRALRMENMREVKIVTGTEPRHLKKRIIIIEGMTITREEALNSLLKIIEEPVKHTMFCLLTGQREQILPTLVSRSLCFTLPWLTEKKNVNSELTNELALFLQTGKGFLNSISAKGAFDASSAEDLFLSCQNALLRTLKSNEINSEKFHPDNELDRFFARLVKKNNNAMQTQLWINEGLEMLAQGVNPARCMEAFASTLHVLGNS